jgi:hypothetical protein
MTDSALTPSRLLKRMSPELRQQAAKAFWLDEEATDDQVQAVFLIAQQKKFRPKFVLGLDIDRKARHLATLGSLPDAIAARVLIVYHLAEQRPMMGAFLDALGIKHEEGLITEESPSAPETATLDAAVKTLSGAYPKEDVARYFWTLLWQDPETWGGLKDRPELALE